MAGSLATLRRPFLLTLTVLGDASLPLPVATERAPENGPMSFDDGTEARIVEAVRAAMARPDSSAGRGELADDAERVLTAMDHFCWNDHWMMNIGDEKGKILDDALRERLEAVRGRRHEAYFTALEFGTYVGYSTVRIARLLPAGATLYTCDPDPSMRAFAREVVQMAGLSQRVEFLTATAQECIQQLRGRSSPLDFVFIDHDKRDYLPALEALEATGLLGQGAAVVADNVDVFQIDDYLSHVRTCGFYKSQHFATALEYAARSADGEPEISDGVEVSVLTASEGEL